jgi:hypothetical protein
VRLLIAVVWGALTLWTILRLGNPDFRSREPDVYRFGIKGYGMIMWALSIVLGTAVWSTLDPARMWYHAGVVAFFLLPAWLWVGFFWAKVFALLLRR